MHFGIENLLTIGIVLLLLILFRLLDRNLRAVNRARRYIDQWREEISSFVEEKTTFIKNFGIQFEVERKSAAELMRRIQSLTREELAQKVQALTTIDDRIREYDTNLEELLQMTGRVQDNLNRLREESSYVEDVEKKVEAEAQIISRKIDEYRETVDRLEHGRVEKLARDEERIERLLTEAVDRAGSRADKVEEAALTRLREQAQERVNHIKTNFEEKVKSVQETVKAKITEINEHLKNNRDEWKAEAANWKKEIHEFDALAKQVKDEWAVISHKTGQELIAATEHRLEEYRQVQEEQYKQLASISNDTTHLEEELRRSMQEMVNRVNGDLARFGNEIRVSWESESGEYTANLKALQKDLAGIDQELMGIKEKSFENVSKKLKGFEDDFLANLSKRSGEIDKQLEAWRNEIDTRLIKELEKTNKENDEKIMASLKRLKDEAAAVEKDLKDAKKSMDTIRLEIAAQSNIAGQTDKVKTELERYIKNMTGAVDRISLLETEINRCDSQLAQIKRLEDDVNSKMNRFLAEKHRIEVMENDFTRLLQTSQSVEQKLAQVSSSDDLLQTMQLQLRHLEDVIKETEEKYQRVERKSKTLQETNDGIDRNFRTLQENEQMVKRLDDTVSLLKTDMDSIRNSVEALSSESEKARDAAEKLSTLEDNIQWLEKRISEMNTARESLGRLATELQNLEKKAKDQVKLVQSVMTRGEGHTTGHKKGKTDEGAPAQGTRENIKKLKGQGWTIDEIAKAYHMSKGEVELTLELPSKDA